MRRRALPDGLLNGLGRVVAWGCLKRCGLRPGDGPNCLRERGAEVPSRARRRIKRIKAEYSFWTEFECEIDDGFC